MRGVRGASSGGVHGDVRRAAQRRRQRSRWTQIGSQSMSVNRLVALFWIGATVCVGIFFEKLLGDFVFGAFRLPNPTIFDSSLSTLLGFAIAIAIAAYCWFNQR